MAKDRPPVALPPIDTDAIRQFCSVVFDGLDGFVPIRLLAEKGTGDAKPLSIFTDVAELTDTLVRAADRAAEQQRAVFAVPATVAKPGVAKAADIAQTRIVVIDLDEGDVEAKRSTLVATLGTPALEVASGGVTPDGQAKCHLYWRLKSVARGADLQRVAALRLAIAQSIGGDPSLGRLHQPIRVPGSIHLKYGKPASVRVLGQGGAEIALADLEARAASLAPQGVAGKAVRTPRQVPPTGRLRYADLVGRVVREGALDGVTRYDALSTVIGHWIREARIGLCTLDEARDAVADHNARWIVPAWDRKRLRREFDAVLALDVHAHGPMPADSLDHDSSTPTSIPPAYSDDALAAGFVRQNGADWHFASGLGWLHWTGTVWDRDQTNLVRHQVRLLCRAVACAAEKGKGRSLASEKTIAAVTRLASSDPRLTIRIDELDTWPMLLNTPDRTVDLKTGELSEPDRMQLLTQITAARPGAGCCPLWHAFLEQITGMDAELERYLARVAGYCLTGSTREQVFFFFHGAGANGKSVFLHTIATAMGSYAATATLDAFMASGQSRHLTELAGLRGARLVLVPETEDGRGWAEARIKAVTGGEKVRANYMRQDHFEFTPAFKLVVAGNHRPELKNVGEAMRRRLHLVPFDVTIRAEDRDPQLPERLRSELDGILGWMIAGCAEWQRIGLAPPERVVSAGEAYFADEDVVGQWIAEQCVTGPAYAATSAALFQSWSSWAETMGIPAGSQRGLGERLRARGFTAAKVSRARGWAGIAIRPGGTDGERAL